MIGNTYFDIAESEYAYLQAAKIFMGDYNNTLAVQCQQVVEKYLKSVIQSICVSENVLCTHKLERLHDTLRLSGVKLGIRSGDLAYLTGMYYDAGYPGENFINVSDESIKECFDTVEAVRSEVLKWREWNEPAKPSEGKLRSLFEDATGDNK